MKIQFASFLLGAVAGIIAHAWILGGKIRELEKRLYWLSPPTSRWP